MADHQADELEQALRRAVGGDVSFDTASRALMTMDASNYRRVPAGVVAPRDADDVAAVLAVCRQRGVPVVARGAGTSIAGQATGLGVVLDFTRHMRSVRSLDPEARTAVVQPGVILDDLRKAAGAHGLTFGPDPSTHSRCTLGGMIGNNSCGSHSVAWGTTADNVHELDVLTYGGERVRAAQGLHDLPARLRDGIRSLAGQHLALLRTGFPELPRRISGYALDELLPEKNADLARALTGSEGTLGVVTEATVRLVEAPGARALAVLGYPDESAAAEAAHTLLPYGPLTVEGMAADLVAGTTGLPKGGAWLFVEVGGATREEALSRAQEVARAAAEATMDHTVVADPAGQRALWRVREDASGTATRLRIPGREDSGEAWPGWEDCAVPPPRLGAYLRDFRALMAQHGLRGTPYGHFGDGCIHVRIDFDLLTEPGIRIFRAFSSDLADLVVAHGGSLSGEHGDGLGRAELLPRMYGQEMVGLFSRFKDLWDPEGGLNPGVLARPQRLDQNLRFDPLPRRPVDVEFGYPHDKGDFSAAVRRCVGVAKCRNESVSGDGVMCPSYRATGEEKHSTRGRARLLHEMLAGEVVQDGWRSEEVRDALDLCLSCKGCRSDCPVEVDMATYKAEFLHHHYEGRVRPAAHYSMGWLPVWLRAAAALRSAPVLNALAGVSPLATLAKRMGGIAPERDIPELAREPFTRWWRERTRAAAARGAEPAAGPGTGSGSGSETGAGAGSGAGPGWRRPGGLLGGAGGATSGPSGRADAAGRAAADQGAGAAALGQGAGRATEGPAEPADPDQGVGRATEAPVRPAASDGEAGRATEGLAGGPAAAGQTAGHGRTVVLWPDTFTNHLSPSVGRSAVAVLEAAGLRVVVPPKPVCCGLTWVSTGQLDRARAVMRRTLDVMAPALDAGLPVVGLEPSCTAALRTDLPELLGGDPRAARLAESVSTFAQALERYTPDWQPPRVDRPVVGQTHCHQHAVLGDAAERRLRERAGLTGALSGGCCGLAGNFGFEDGHYEVSVACAEEQLLPSVRAAEPGTEVLADGYSCRTQLNQLAGRKGRHLAEILAERLP
ncbi:FAD-binding and (Fe-S)-binding domain-containing protein [Streptomyces malaysiensis]|uniref:FAD-binding and (Fe-S)-binding domain-containing protein n=1 Tax=Streptomyces malaysiensis TaxID=92644 RepID=UPI000BFCCC26|nr:FAD-binding and (Fe-S)-binding domain-containing protein [Streptomyces malaysiensis]ATL83654.1 oxidoreductase [Streptomyces malaysiensis]